MKILIKGLGLIVVGLVTAIVIYPFLHELGHSVVAYLVGAEVLEINLLPIPSVLCNVTVCSKNEMALIGASGILLPFILTEIKVPHGFWNWYIWLLVRSISLLAIIISIVGIFCFWLNRPILNEDITQLLTICPKYGLICLGVFSILLCVGIKRIFKSRPLTRCLKEFDVK